MSQIQVREGKISEVCTALGVSRDELAKRMGVSSSSAYQVDSGRAQPSAKFIGALIAVTSRPFEDLFVVSEDVPA